MVFTPCEFCQGVGTIRDGHACTYCGATGKDPYARGGPPTPSPRGGGGSAPLPRSAQFVVVAAAIIVGFTIYNLNGATDAAKVPAFVAFFGTLFAGSILVRFLSNPVPLLLLGAILIGVDLYFFDGAMTPRAGAFLSSSWEYTRDALLP